MEKNRVRNITGGRLKQRKFFPNFIFGAPLALQICKQMESGGIHLHHIVVHISTNSNC
jgi:hypothetical protein